MGRLRSLVEGYEVCCLGLGCGGNLLGEDCVRGFWEGYGGGTVRLDGGRDARKLVGFIWRVWKGNQAVSHVAEMMIKDGAGLVNPTTNPPLYSARLFHKKSASSFPAKLGTGNLNTNSHSGNSLPTQLSTTSS